MVALQMYSMYKIEKCDRIEDNNQISLRWKYIIYALEGEHN